MTYAEEIGAPLYTVFLDVQKAYDSVDRNKLIQLLELYGLGINIRMIVMDYWSNHK